MATYESAFTRPPAPAPLDLVQSFLNSVDLEDGPDAFVSIESFTEWVEHHLPGHLGTIAEADRLRAIAVREALRDVVEGTRPDEALSTLRSELEGMQVTLRIRDDGQPEFVAARKGIDILLSRVAASMQEAMINGSWERLKICRNDACRWAFYDTSKNHSGVWCSMATCGARAKSRRYRTRSKAQGGNA
jgi:predicted RNA-binding Zn ribbon-like protein